MARHGRSFIEARAKVDREHEHQPREAIKLVKDLKRAKFDESVEIHVRTGLNVRHADEQLRGTIALPNGLGKEVTIAVFAKGDKAKEAEDAGADVVGAEDLAEKIEGGFDDFDVAIATPDLMPVVGRLGRILGPAGKMPNPKVGTVTMDVAKAVRDSKGGRVEFRVDKTGVIHTVVGKSSFSETALVENLGTLMDAVTRARPTGVKGDYIKSVHITSTQGPSVKLDLGATLALSGRATA
jgi:large subunit ribosomal protein L1